jgi:hypothetical protein
MFETPHPSGTLCVYSNRKAWLPCGDRRAERHKMKDETTAVPAKKIEDLTETSEAGSIELAESDLERVAGGDADYFRIYIKGE